MPATLTRSIFNPSFDEHLKNLIQTGADVKAHTDNDCGNCKICRYNHLFVLGEGGRRHQLAHSNSSDSNMSPRLPTMTTAGFNPEEGNGKPVLSPRDRVLRIINIWLWVPAFPFLLAHGIVSGMLCPVLGIIPMTISLLCAVFHLSHKTYSRGLNIFIDTFTSCFLISILIPGWVFMAEQNCWRWWCGGSGITMVGTYGTVPMMISFVIHTWFVLKEINWKKMNCFSRDREGDDNECPHCHGDVSARARKEIKKGKQRQREMVQEGSGYGRVTMHDAEAESKEYEVESAGRPSTDDETARLV